MTVPPQVIAAAIGAGGSLLGAGGSAGSAMLSYKANKKLQENQAKLNYKYAEKQARNNPTWNRAGLEAAGYNPMLAVQNATSGANSSWASGSSAQTPDFGANIVANAQSFQRLMNETEQAKAYSRNQNAEAIGKELTNMFIPERQRSEILKINSDTVLNDATVENLKSRLELDRILGFAGLDVQRRGVGVQAYNATTARKSYDLDSEMQSVIRDREKRYKEFGRRHPYLRNFDETLTRYFNGFSAGASRSSVNKR